MESDFLGLKLHTLLFVFLGLWGGIYHTNAQTVIFSEEFDNWDTPSCPQGWSCISSTGCETGGPCFWGRDDTFDAVAKPSEEDCDGWGRYARCNSSNLSFGEFASIITPSIDLSTANSTDNIILSFCYINSSSQALDGDGIRVSFSANGGTGFEPQFLDLINIYNQWENISINIPAEFRTADFQIRIDGLGDQSSGDIGIDQFKVIDNTNICEAQNSVVQTAQKTEICKGNQPILIGFGNDIGGTIGENYSYILTDGLDIIKQIIPGDSINANNLDVGSYRVYGVSFSGSLNATLGNDVNSISADICTKLSNNYIRLDVYELSGSILLLSDYNGSPISCPTSQDGIAKVSASGGLIPYQYFWDNGESSETVTNLNAGTHTVQIKDNAGCQASAAITIAPPQSLRVLPTIQNTTCKNTSDGSIQLEVEGGIPPYEYSWSNGSKDSIISSLQAGTYVSSIIDENGCQTIISHEVAAGSEMEVEVMTIDASCFGLADGTAMAQASNGIPPYSFSWSNGVEEADLFDLAAGTYQVTATDQSGCEITKEIEISQTDSIKLTLNSTPDNGTKSGKAFVEIEGGVPPYSVLWSTGDTTQQIASLDDGSYSVTVTDGNGCIVVASVMVEENLKLDCLEIHTGFTPNGDGVNESWFIPCIQGFRQNEVIILNRWGQELFRMEDYDNSWNGTVNGKRLPDGTYFYIVKLNTPTDKRTFKGTVTIIR